MKIDRHFIEIGGEFITPFSILEQKVQNIQAIIFDWDGVFNNGIKQQGIGTDLYPWHLPQKKHYLYLVV